MGIPRRLPPYQPLGDLWIRYSRAASDVRDYRRELDLDSGIARVSYSIDTHRYEEEVFSSAIDQVIVVHLTCDRPGMISFYAELNREQDSKTEAIAPDKLALSGEAIAHDEARHAQEPKEGVKFYAVVRAIAKGGISKTSGDHIVVQGANSVTL